MPVDMHVQSFLVLEAQFARSWSCVFDLWPHFHPIDVEAPVINERMTLLHQYRSQEFLHRLIIGVSISLALTDDFHFVLSRVHGLRL
jgi:hypothetical protein